MTQGSNLSCVRGTADTILSWAEIRIGCLAMSPFSGQACKTMPE